MKGNRDLSLVWHINNHFSDINSSIDKINTNISTEIRKSILFDFMQIGELLNQLSKQFLELFNNSDIYKLISMRNRIVHGYSSIKDEIVFNSIKQELPIFIEKLNICAKEYQLSYLLQMLGKKVEVNIDRPKGYIHNEIKYSLNYGYIKDFVALDNEYQDVYVINEEEPIDKFCGVVVGVIHRKNDIENKLVVSKNNRETSIEKIKEQVDFQEHFFDYEILIK